MLYILLVIIAIGVLLASESGKQFLNVLIILGLIAGGLYIGFWVVVIGIGLLSEKELRDNMLAVLGGVMLTAYAIYGLYLFYKKYQRGEFKKEVVKSKAKELWLKNWNSGIGSKIAMVFLILAFSFLTYMLIYSFTIKDFWQQ